MSDYVNLSLYSFYTRVKLSEEKMNLAEKIYKYFRIKEKEFNQYKFGEAKGVNKNKLVTARFNYFIQVIRDIKEEEDISLLVDYFKNINKEILNIKYIYNICLDLGLECNKIKSVIEETEEESIFYKLREIGFNTIFMLECYTDYSNLKPLVDEILELFKNKEFLEIWELNYGGY